MTPIDKLFQLAKQYGVEYELDIRSQRYRLTYGEKELYVTRLLLEDLIPHAAFTDQWNNEHTALTKKESDGIIESFFIQLTGKLEQ